MTKSERLHIIWDELVKAVKAGTKVFCSEIAPKVSGANIDHGLWMESYLGVIGEKCNELGVPCLNALVANKGSGECMDAFLVDLKVQNTVLGQNGSGFLEILEYMIQIILGVNVI